MSKKLLSFILAVLLVMPAVVSCSDNKDETANTSSAENTQPNQTEVTETEEETKAEILDDLPEVTYDGYEYMIYNGNELTNDWFITNYVNFTEDSADVLESAVYRRNRLVEERFDIAIQETILPTTTIRTSCMAADGSFDLCLITGTNSISLAQDGYLYDQMQLEHIDLEKPYWDQNEVKELTIAGKLFHTAGDFLTTHLDGVKVFFFNKGLITDYNLTSPYEYVNDMNWTIDTMSQLAWGVSGDLNGDGVYNDNDRFGILSWSGALYPALVCGTGEKFLSKDENDKPSVTFFTERFVQAFEAIVNMCHANGDTVTYDANTQNTKGLSNNHRVQEIMFPNNQALFWNENIAWSKALRNMEMDFGIIPAPMLNVEQAHYYNYVGGNYFGTNIPVCVKDVERASIILEALNSMSTGLVTDAYYDVMLKSKLSRDEESSAMLDIIFDNLVYDLSVVFGLASIKDKITDMLANSDMDVASYYNKNQRAMNKMIENAYKKISALEH